MLGGDALRDEVMAIAMDHIADSPGAAVLLVGDAGMGKTVTLRELARRLLRAEAVHNLVEATAQPGDTLATLLGHQSEPEAAEVGAAIFALGHEGPMVALTIDDVHNVDSSVLPSLAGLVQTRRTTMLLASRPGPFVSALVAALDGRLRTIELGPLDRQQTQDLLSRLHPGLLLDHDSVTRVHELSGGNPLFIRELDATLSAREQWVMSRGVLAWRGALPATGSLHALVEGSLERLPMLQRRFVELVALLNEIPLAAVESLIRPEDLPGLVRDGHLQLVQSGPIVLCRPGHPIIGEVVRSTRLGSAHLRDLLAVFVEQVLHHLADLRGIDMQRLPDWSVRSGVQLPLDLLRSLTRPGVTSQPDGTPPEVWSLLLAHPEAGPLDLALGHLSRAELTLLVPDFLAAKADVEAARACLAAVPDRTPSMLDVRLAMGTFDTTVGIELDLEKAMAELGAAAEGLVGHAGLQRSLRTMVAGREAFLGLYDLAIPVVRELLREPPPDLYSARVTGFLSALMAYRGEMAEGLAGLRRCRVFVQQHRPIDMGAILQLEGTEALLHVMAGRPATADRLLARAREDGPRLAAAGDETSALMIALTSMTRGEWADVVTWARRACDSLTVTDSGGFRRMALAALAAGLAGTGQRDAARGALIEAESVNRVNLGLEPFTRGAVARAKFLLADSDVADYARASLELAHAGGFVLLDPFFRLALAAWDADAVDDDFVAAAASLAERFDNPIIGETAQYLRAVQDGDSEAIGLHLRRLSRLGLWVPPKRQDDRLTLREREVGQLAALGYNTKEIARRLYLSPRTVDAHLRHVFEKLGVKRDDLPEALL